MGKLEKVVGAVALKIFKGFVVEKNVDSSEIKHSQIKKILLVIRHQMGDMLCSVPMMLALRNFYQGAQITLVTKKSTRFEEIFTGNNPPVDEVKYYEHGIENFFKLAKELEESSFDLAIVPSSVVFSATNHLLTFYSKAKYKIGVKSKDYDENPIGYVLNIKNDFLWDSKKIHQIERNLDVIRQINVTPLEDEIKLSLPKSAADFAADFYGKHFPDRTKPVIGFHPGAAKEQNIWPAEKFAELAGMLHQKFGAYIFISEGPNDAAAVAKMEKLLRENHQITGLVKHKGELMNNTAIISRLNLFITNDTGVMHLASGFEVPLISLFGPTSAWEWGPIGVKRVCVQAADQDINSIETAKIFETSIDLLNV